MRKVENGRLGLRYSKTDYLNGKFYQLSKELFKGSYKKLSNNERVLYSVLKDRFELSIRNEWVDQENNIYFIFEQVQLSEECCMSLKTVQRAMQNLMKCFINLKKRIIMDSIILSRKIMILMRLRGRC